MYCTFHYGGTYNFLAFKSEQKFDHYKKKLSQFPTKNGILLKKCSDLLYSYGTFLQQLECGYEFPALIHVWITSAGVLELFISTSG